MREKTCQEGEYRVKAAVDGEAMTQSTGHMHKLCLSRD